MTKKEKQKNYWMALFEDECLKLGHPAGKIDWDTADFLYTQNITSTEAAEKYMKNVDITKL